MQKEELEIKESVRRCVVGKGIELHVNIKEKRVKKCLFQNKNNEWYGWLRPMELAYNFYSKEFILY